MRQRRPELLCCYGESRKYRCECGKAAIPHCASERLQQCLGARHVEYTRFFDVQRLDDTIVDEHRIALRAHPHAFLPAVELQTDSVREFAAAVAQHDDLAVAILLVTPGAHDKIG